jgi:hypothetical protein
MSVATLTRTSSIWRIMVILLGCDWGMRLCEGELADIITETELLPRRISKIGNFEATTIYR